MDKPWQWQKGKSSNPAGRPKGVISMGTLWRWKRFCLALMEPPFTGAAAARKAGYSHKSARFIACRLLEKAYHSRDVLRVAGNHW